MPNATFAAGTPRQQRFEQRKRRRTCSRDWQRARPEAPLQRWLDLVKEATIGIVKERAFRQRLARTFTHPVTLLAVATVFATVAGVWLTNDYQERAWVREKRVEVFRHGFDAGLQLIDELSEAMSRRLFGLHRVIWIAKGTGTGELEQVWNDYYESVVDWNVRLLREKARLTRLVGPEAAEAFASAQDAALSYQAGTPASLHGQFMIAHQKVRALVDCVRQRCAEPATQTALKDAQQDLHLLGLAVDQFLQSCTDRIYELAQAA